MSKSDKIREFMYFAYAGGVYHRGIVFRGREYIYFLDSMGNIERCNVRLYDAGCPEWETWATDTAVIRALTGHDIAMECTGKSVSSFFHRGDTLTPWDIYVRDFGGVAIR